MSQNNSPQNSPLRPRRADHLVQNSGFDFAALFHAILEKAWLVLLIFVVSIFATASYLHRAPILYQATATIQIDQEDSKVFATTSRMGEMDTRSLEVLRTIEQTLKSTTLVRSVVESNKLYTLPAFGGRPDSPPSDVENLIGAVSSMTDVKLRKGTRLIDILVISKQPQIAQLVANSVVTNYLIQNAQGFRSFLDDAQVIQTNKANELENQLKAAEIALHAYSEEVKTVSLDTKTVSTEQSTLATYNQKLTEARSARLKLESDFAQIQKLGTNVEALLSISEVAANFAVIEAKNNVNKYKEAFASITNRYGPKLPQYRIAEKQLEDAKQNLHDSVLGIPVVIKRTLESALAAEKELEKLLEAQEKIVSDLNQKAIHYRELQRNVDSLRTTYDLVVARMRETDLTREGASTKIKIAQVAELPRAPFSPVPKRIWTQGILGGLFAGILFAIGINSLDSTFKTVDQVEEHLGLPVLSAILQMRERNADGTALIAAENAKSAGAEAFRSLRTALSMLGKAEGRRTFLFTSALPQEGKTFCSVNFAASLAQQGLKTLIIDGDLRRPAVELALLGKRTKLPGVTDFLTGQKKLNEIIQSTTMESLSYISAGTTAPNPAELLAQNGINSLIEEALLRFDRVVVDSAPIHAVSDTLLMLDRIQTVCLVVRAGKTARRGVARAVQILQGVEAPMGGIILNRLPRRRGPGYYYNSYYDYSYKDKYGEKGVYGA
ncbi:MAG: hypothetical protein JWN25_1498 [Verrucomicrobiales bacterium]|nr:hypothetical protein [Verrucomicrobiales bacterium]